jgi:putative ABC transport system permease protein
MPDWTNEVRRRLTSLRLSPEREAEIVDELSQHLDDHYRELIAGGATPEDASRLTLAQFRSGNLLASYMSSLRQAHASTPIAPGSETGHVWTDFWQDLRYAMRGFRKLRAFTVAAVLILALGIGATSAIFGVVRTVMLKPLPYRDPDRIVGVWETNRGGTARNVIAPVNFVAWRERTHTLDHLGMVGPTSMSMMINGEADQVSGMMFSSAAFRALGVQPAMGRAYTDEEDLGGKNGVMVLSFEFWQNRLGGRPDVIGMTFKTHDEPRTVVGVMPPGFTVVGQKADYLIPYGQTPDELRAVRGRGSSYAVARLHDGISFDAAQREMRDIQAQLEKENPQLNAQRTMILLPIQEQMVSELRPAMFALVGAVSLVLLVACVNVANLLVARGAGRARELGLRTALGARRARLVRQMLTESLVLAAAGGIVGLVVAVLVHRGLLALVGEAIVIPRLDQLTLDFPVILFTMVITLTTAVLFGVIPAFVSTSHANDALRESGRHGAGRRLRRVLSALVVVEVAFSLVLLAGAGLLMRSFLELQSVDPGFRADGVVTAAVALPSNRYDDARAGRFFDDARSQIAALPGVRNVAGASCQPLPFSCIGTSFWRADQAKPQVGQLSSGQVRPITPGFFTALRIPQLAGRDFAASDTVDSLPVAIISEEIARKRFPDGSPIGRRLRINFDHANGRDDVEWTIVGVVGNMRSSLDGPFRETIFVPLTQRPNNFRWLFVVGEQDPAAIASSVTGALRSMEPEAPVVIRMLEDVIAGTIARPRALSVLVGVFAVVAIALAAVGVYGVMAYSVRERTQEIGVRMALGATPRSVLRLVLGEALRLVGLGIVAGLVMAAALVPMLAQLLFGVRPFDPWTFVMTAGVLLIIATLASYLPARRGMRMPPVDALRTD